MKERMEKRFNKNGNGMEMSPYPPMPRSLNIELTSACNHNCVFCPYHSWMLPESERRPSHTMTYEAVVSLLERAKRDGIGYDEIGFHMTGESVLHKDFVRCVAKAKELGCPYVFTTTNGAQMPPEKIKAAAEAGLDSLRFSVNGYTREMYKEMHGRDDFETVLNNLEYLKKYKSETACKMNTSISVVLTKTNYKDRDKFEKLLAEYVDELVFIPVLSMDRISKEAQDKYGFESDGRFEYTPCPAVFNSFYISSEGYVVPCCSTTKIDGMILGNIHETDSLKDIWLGEGFVDMRQKFLEGTIPSKWCEGCVLINKEKPMTFE